MKLLMCIAYVAVLGILAHYIGESLPRSLFFENIFPYKSYRFEKNGKLYDKINIKRWKARLPDMSRVMGDMLPKRVTYKTTPDKLQALIKETCIAEFIHGMLCVFSIGIYIIWKSYIGIILTLVFIICNLPFIIIQRYNRPHLISLRNRLTMREEKLNFEGADTVL